MTIATGREERGITRSVLYKAVLVVSSVAAIIIFIRPVLSDYFSRKMPEAGGARSALAARLTGESARYHYLLGVSYDDISNRASIQKSITHYILSIKRNPADSQTWLALAKAYQKVGMKEEALFAAGKAVSLEKNNSNLMWEAGVFFLLADRPSQAVQLFKRYIYMVPTEQESVYLLCYTMGIQPSYILENLIPDDQLFYKRYLNFLVGNKIVNESMDVWKKMVRRFRPHRSEYVRFCDFLIASGELEEALALWGDFQKKFNPGLKEKSQDEIIRNGDFEMPIEGGGFDWTIGSAEGVRISKDRDIKWSGLSSLNVNFNGKSNPSINIARQIIPVSPGRKYKVTAYIRTEKLTTRNGIFLEASDSLCEPFARRTEPVTGTSHWQRIELEFSTPKKCRTISLNIRRDQSDKFDSKISGDAWIDSLSMIQARTN